MKIWFKAVFALLLLTSVLSADTPTPAKPVPATQTPPTNTPPAAKDAKPVEKSKFALLNAEKESLNEEDFGNIFQQDLSSLSNADVKIDNDCGMKLDLALKGAATDPNALAFIFTQATEGRLCAMLSQKPAEVEAAMKNFKDTEGFTPVTNKNGAKAPVVPTTPATTPAATNATPAAANTSNTNNGQTVNSGNNVDPKVIAAQKAKQDEQMKAAQDAINSLFAQVGNKMNTNAQIPSMNFGGNFGGNNGATQADLGAGLARVPVNAARN